MNAKNVVILILAIFFFVFILQNTQVVEVRFLFWKISMSRALMLSGSLFIGLVIGWLLKSYRSKKSLLKSTRPEPQNRKA
jgi:putative membrane protein